MARHGPHLPVLALTLTAALGYTSGPASAAPQTPQRGEAVFREKCVACHTVGGGNTIGPDLVGVTARRDRGWLTRWIAAPERLLAQRDSLAVELLRQFNNVPMPNMGLSAGDVASVVAYLEQGGGATAALAAARSESLPPGGSRHGDPGIGKELFTGIARLSNGGPPCIGCHSVAGIGALGGGALGPDLTAAATKFGDAGLATVLASTPFPTMTPIFGRQPLTSEEQAHLLAYLQQAPAMKRPARAAWQLVLLAAAGAALLLAVAKLVWRRRLRAVRHTLLHRPAGRAVGEPAGKGA